MKQKVKIPENILEAAKDAWRIYADYPCDPHDLRFQQTVVPVIEAAFGALGDHPIVPTQEQMKSLLRDAGLSPSGEHPEAMIGAMRWLVGECQRRMFLATEQQFDTRTKVLHIVQDIGRSNGISSVNCEQYTDAIMEIFQ